jgi:hypothetical protein
MRRTTSNKAAGYREMLIPHATQALLEADTLAAAGHVFQVEPLRLAAALRRCASPLRFAAVHG